LLSSALSGIAEELVKAGQKERASQLFDRAFQVAQKIKDGFQRSLAFLDVAEALARAGQTDRSLQVIQNALYAAQTTFASLQLEALAKIAVALARMRQKDLAIQVIQNAFQIARKIDLEPFLSSPLKDIAKVFAELGQIDRTFQVIRRIGDANERSEILSDIAMELA
jgi:tetratricopeptide (TPR) repeat protein